MADKKISALTAATTPLAGTEVLPIVQSGATVKVSVDNLTTGKAVSGTQFTASTGNFIVGTAGKGVDFSANTHAAGMTSEVLTWYEEGTWTPAYSAASGAFTTLTYSAQTGTYVRIGKVVYIKGEIRTSNVVLGTAAGILRITGLPFTPSGSEAAIGVNLFIRFNLAASLRITSATLDTSGIYFETSSSNDTGANQVAATEMTTGATASRNYVRFSGFYNV